MNASLQSLSEATGRQLKVRGWMLATAESCTGGWIAEVVTATAGSSSWFDRGFVTYSNEAKQEMLGVDAATLNRYGAVSSYTAAEMAEGARAHSRAQVALSVSGIAGPGGATPGKPVGMVCFGWALPDQPVHSETCHFDGDRESVRLQAVIHALTTLNNLVGAAP